MLTKSSPQLGPTSELTYLQSIVLYNIMTYIYIYRLVKIQLVLHLRSCPQLCIQDTVFSYLHQHHFYMCLSMFTLYVLLVYLSKLNSSQTDPVTYQ